MQRPGSFGWLLAGQAVSAIGSQVTFMALPLIAVVTLNASPGEMGLLGALDNLPYLLFGLAVGSLVDRHRRRSLMMIADLARAAAVVSIPVVFIFHGISFAHLCVVAFAVGIGNIVFDVACQAQLPDLVEQDRLVGANGALQTSTGIASLAAPGLVGVFIATVGAPVAMLVDAFSYLLSAGSLVMVRRCAGREPEPKESGTSPGAEIKQGLVAVLRDRRLVGLAGAGAFVSIGMNAAFAVLIHDLSNVVGLGSLGIGFVFFTFAVCAALGALAASQLAARGMVGRCLMVGPLLGGLGLVVFALAGRIAAPGVLLVHVGAALAGAGLLAQQSLAAGLRQSLAPEEMRGRILGTLRFAEWGVMPLGSLIGGAVGEVAGTGAALVVSACWVAVAALWVVTTPLRGLRAVPQADPDSQTDPAQTDPVTR